MEYLFTDLFDENNKFDMLMLEVMSAKNDLYQMSKMICENSQKESNVQTMRASFFCFKYHLAIIKESAELLTKGIFAECHNKIIKEFPNYTQIEKYATKFEHSKQRWREILRLVRNHTYHYAQPKEYTKIIKGNEYRDFKVEVVFGENMGDVYFPFVDQLYFDIIGSQYCKENLKLIDETAYSDMFEELSHFATDVAVLLDAIAFGFIQYKNMLKQDN